MSATGSVKRDPVSGAVAIRTIFDDDTGFGSQAWLVATTNRGAVFLKSADVDGWDDLFVPESGPEPDPYA